MTRADSTTCVPVPADGLPIREPAADRDDALAERFARGEAAAFDELVAVYREPVTRLAHRLLGWSADAEDVVQEVFLAALKNARRFRRGSSLRTWLTAITLNKCRSHRRGLIARVRMLAGFGARKAPEAPPADAGAMDADAFAQVRAALLGLSPRNREVIVLHYLEGATAEEMAGALGITRGSVEVRLHRARARLRELLGVADEEHQ